MDWGLVFQVVGIGLTVVGLMIAGFWRMWGLISGVRDEADRKIDEVKQEANLRAEAAKALASATARELADHKLHVAETYFPRANMREVMDPVMEAISGVRDQITGMSGRIDRLMERPAPARTRSTP